jgi:hypothetical protein
MYRKIWPRTTSDVSESRILSVKSFFLCSYSSHSTARGRNRVCHAYNSRFFEQKTDFTLTLGLMQRTKNYTSEYAIHLIESINITRLHVVGGCKVSL